MRPRSLILSECLDARNDMPPRDRKSTVAEKLSLEVLVDIRDTLQKGLKLVEILALDHARKS